MFRAHLERKQIQELLHNRVSRGLSDKWILCRTELSCANLVLGCFFFFKSPLSSHTLEGVQRKAIAFSHNSCLVHGVCMWAMWVGGCIWYV